MIRGLSSQDMDNLTVRTKMRMYPGKGKGIIARNGPVIDVPGMRKTKTSTQETDGREVAIEHGRGAGAKVQATVTTTAMSHRIADEIEAAHEGDIGVDHRNKNENEKDIVAPTVTDTLHHHATMATRRLPVVPSHLPTAQTLHSETTILHRVYTPGNSLHPLPRTLTHWTPSLALLPLLQSAVKAVAHLPHQL